MFSGQVLPENIFLFFTEIILCFIGLWSAFLLNKNFSVLPVPAQNSVLIDKGPYKYIRHAIYIVVIVLAMIWIAGKFSMINLFVWFALVIVLIVKINYEEKLLSEKFVAYRSYMNSSKKLIPFIY